MKNNRIKVLMLICITLFTWVSTQATEVVEYIIDFESDLGSWTGVTIDDSSRAGSKVATLEWTWGGDDPGFTTINATNSEHKVITLSYDYYRTGITSGGKPPVMMQHGASPWKAAGVEQNGDKLELFVGATRFAGVTIDDSTWYNVEIKFNTLTNMVEMFVNGELTRSGFVAPINLPQFDKVVTHGRGKFPRLDNFKVTTELLSEIAFSEMFDSGDNGWSNITTETVDDDGKATFGATAGEKMFDSPLTLSTKADKAITWVFDYYSVDNTDGKFELQNSSDAAQVIGFACNDGIVTLNAGGTTIVPDTEILIDHSVRHNVKIMYDNVSKALSLYMNDTVLLERVIPGLDVSTLDKVVGIAASGSFNVSRVAVAFPFGSASISAFNFKKFQYGSSVIDEENLTINVEVLPGTNIADSLILDYSLTTDALSTEPSTGDTIDFTTPVEIEVTSLDNTSKTYTVTVTEVHSKMLSFELPGQVESTINEEDTTITVEMYPGTDITALKPELTILGEVDITPHTSLAQDFTTPVTYTITNTDGTTLEYEVTVTVPSAEITSFTLPEYMTSNINDADNSILIKVVSGTDITSVKPIVEIYGSYTSFAPDTSIVQDFTNPIDYTLTNNDGSTLVYTVTVDFLPENVEYDTLFIETLEEGNLDNWGDDPKVTLIPEDFYSKSAVVDFGTVSQWHNLYFPEISITKAENKILQVSYKMFVPTGGSAQSIQIQTPDVPHGRFGLALNDGKWDVVTSTQSAPYARPWFWDDKIFGDENGFNDEWFNVRLIYFSGDGVVRGFVNDEKKIEMNLNNEAFNSISKIAIKVRDGGTTEGFRMDDFFFTTQTHFEDKVEVTDLLNEEIHTKDIDTEAKTMDIVLKRGTNVNKFRPMFEMTKGASYTYKESVPDYSKPVVYVMESEDMGTTVEWTVNYSVFESSEAELTDMNVDGKARPVIIDTENDSLHIEVLYGTDVSSLVPSFIVSDYATTDVAADSVMDFTDPGSITVIAEDGTEKEWGIKVSVGPAVNIYAYIESVAFEGLQSYSFHYEDGNDSLLVVAEGDVDITSIKPEFTISKGASITDTTAAKDFSTPQTYTVVSEDNAVTKVWTVNIVTGASRECDILTFALEGAAGLIDGDTIRVEVPYGTDLSSATPEVTVSEDATFVANGVNFNKIVTYTVTAEDGVTTKEYFVKVTSGLNPAAEFTSFKLMAGVRAPFGVIDSENATITVEILEEEVDLDDSFPAIFSLSLGAGATIGSDNFMSGVTQVNYSDTVKVTVTAAAGNTKEWSIIVNKEEGESSLENSNLQSISLYPNPVVNELVIESEALIAVYIYTITGNLVKAESHVNYLRVDFSGMNNGMYLIKLTDIQSGDVVIRKIVK